jgi:hypothetical protein
MTPRSAVSRPSSSANDDAALGGVQAELLGERRVQIGDGGAGQRVAAAEPRRVARRLLGRRDHADAGVADLAGAPEGELRRRAGRHCGDAVAETLRVVDGMAVDLQQHVPDPDAGTRCRAALGDILDEHTLGFGETEGMRDLPVDRLGTGAKPRPRDMAVPGSRGEHRAD